MREARMKDPSMSGLPYVSRPVSLPAPLVTRMRDWIPL